MNNPNRPSPIWRATSLFGAAFGILLLASACGTPRRGAPFTGPPPRNDPRFVKGEQAFMTHCHQCHPGGEAGLGPSLNDKPGASFLLKPQARLGLGVMPSFDRETLPPDDLQAISYYIGTLRGQKPQGWRLHP